MRIAIQGEQGSFSHEAALRMGTSGPAFHSVEIISCALSPEVFRRLVDGEVDAAVIPIENSIAGSVLEHYDLMLEQPVRIESESLLRIRHNLIAAPGVSLDEVRDVYSHPIALAQCRRFFAAHPSLRAMPFYDTAGSAAHAVASGAPIAGIASEHAARIHGGEILMAGIEEHPSNFTRFLLLRRQGEVSLLDGNAFKVSIAFAVPHRPGSLVEALQTFAQHGLNLTRLESRPVPGSPWEYMFYADYQLRSREEGVTALAKLSALCPRVKELGCYPEAQSLPS